MQNSFPISAPLSLGELLDRAFRLYRARFGSMTLTAAILLVPYGIFTAVAFGLVAVDYFDMLRVFAENPNANPDEFMTTTLPGVFAFGIGAVIVGLLGLVIQAIVTLALTQQSISALNGEELTWRAAIRLGMQRFWAYVGMIILQSLGILLATTVLMAIFGCAAFVLFSSAGVAAGVFDGFGAGEPNAAAMVGIVLAVVCAYLFFILLLLVPATYLSARWTVAAPGLIDQRWGPMEALTESWVLSKGNVWRCIFYVVLLAILSFVISVPTFILQQAANLGPPQFLPIAIALSTGVGSLISVVWQPFNAAALTLLYYDLRIREEGLDLVQRIDQLAEEEVQDEFGVDAALPPATESPTNDFS